MRSELDFKDFCLGCNDADVTYDVRRYTKTGETVKRFFCSHKNVCKRYNSDIKQEKSG